MENSSFISFSSAFSSVGPAVRTSPGNACVLGEHRTSPSPLQRVLVKDQPPLYQICAKPKGSGELNRLTPKMIFCRRSRCGPVLQLHQAIWPCDGRRQPATGRDVSNRMMNSKRATTQSPSFRFRGFTRLYSCRCFWRAAGGVVCVAGRPGGDCDRK